MQFFLTVPHDTAEEPTMASMDPAELEAALAAVEEFNADLHKSGAFRFAGPAPAVVGQDRRRHEREARGRRRTVR
jgi:hypothetical protein